MHRPTEEEIAKVMRETGMAYIQARNHLICRFMLQERLARGPVRELGKSNYE